MSDLKTKIDEIMYHGMLAASIALGRKMNLFDALAKTGTEAAPVDAAAVADAAGCKERYVHEWLCTMACGRLIHITPDEKFWMDAEQKQEFLGFNNLSVAESSFLPCMMKGFDKLTEAFQKNSGRYGLDYSEFADFYATMDIVTQAMHGKHLISDYFPLIGMKEKLEAGGLSILDVGCGSGWHAIQMATNFPRCTVTAFDLSESAIQLAKKAAVDTGKDLRNLEFRVLNAKELLPEWTASFDFVTIFDACHDQQRPDLCIREIYRLLKPGGLFAMLEVAGTSNAYEDMQQSEMNAAWYAISMFHCLPVAYNSPDALGLGTKWGERKARKLLTDCGFKETDIEVLKPTFFPINYVYLCRK